MKTSVVMVLMGVFLVAAPAFGQQKTVTGKVASEQGAPLSGALIAVKGTSTTTSTNREGAYSISAEVGQVLRHARVATTAIYAKVDHRALDALVLPWPGGES